YYSPSYFIILYAFFFSSRRRHTRSKRDWSSDVCSSDLLDLKSNLPSNHYEMDKFLKNSNLLHAFLLTYAPFLDEKSFSLYSRLRSEERRVGKECRLQR